MTNGHAKFLHVMVHFWVQAN